MEANFKEEVEVVRTFEGARIWTGRRISRSFRSLPIERMRFRVILEEAVSTEDGTGIVHSAPAFGEMDFFACKREGIELVCPVDSNGRFTAEVPPYAGQLVKDADKEIVRDLKKQGSLFLSGDDPA